MNLQPTLFEGSRLEVPADVLALLHANAPVAIGVSGGKDSVACAIATAEYLAGIGHAGPKILIHSDLGMVEWQDSLPSCERVATYLAAKYGGWKLHVTSRRQGGMMEKWEQRWESSVRRYRNLECVKLILPWSTPALRFCTSHLKTAPINSYLKKLFGRVPIVSVTGIRSDESPARAKKPASKPNPELPTGSLDWNPLLRWNVSQVFDTIKTAGLRLHEAYTVFGSSRVSCAFCIMSSDADRLAARRDPRNRTLLLRMCELELVSAFAFQGNFWLASLESEFVVRLDRTRWIAQQRNRAEAAIPKHLLFTKGWPEVMPTPDEADLLASIRREVCRLYGWEPTFATREAVLDRYIQLMREKDARNSK